MPHCKEKGFAILSDTDAHDAHILGAPEIAFLKSSAMKKDSYQSVSSLTAAK